MHLAEVMSIEERMIVNQRVVVHLSWKTLAVEQCQLVILELDFRWTLSTELMLTVKRT